LFVKIVNIKLLTLLLSFAMLSPAYASEDLIEQWYMQPRLNLKSAQNTQMLLTNKNIFIGQALDNRINLEINLLSDKSEIQSEHHGIVLDGRYYMNQSEKFSSYVAGGISHLKNSRNPSIQNEQSTNVGLGFEHTLNGNGTKILADFRYFIDDNQKSELDQNIENDWTLSLGVSIPLSMDLFK